ncbi:MAG TPA: alpha/beta fold hydrolase [Candidatus Binataceae bacterium]|nr:alpha/beta fold hydrolase [Candidatus Binataceae bacterium]
MDVQLGRFRAQCERPEPAKFAWPIVLVPDLFTATRHLAVLMGYLATIGWEVYAPDFRVADAGNPGSMQGPFRFADLAAMVREAIDALTRDAIVLGHGAGGLAALAIAAHPRVKAAVAYAPLIPGFRTALGGGIANRFAAWRGKPIKPPTGRQLFEFIADADPYQRDGLIAAMVPASGALMADIAAGTIDFGTPENSAPRLIVAGDSDVFAPRDRTVAFAKSIGAKMAIIPGRGHWLIGGRALERAIGEAQRFLVRALGQDLLLLYPEEWKNDPDPED